MTDRPAPPVTITDPNHPEPSTEVLLPGDERTPWRPSRSVWLTAALLVVSVPAVLALKHRGDERTADRLALEKLSIVEAGDGEYDGEGYVFRNDGSITVTVLSGRFDREGAKAASFDAVLEPGDDTRLALPVPEACPPVVPQNGPARALLTVRTPAGTREVVVDVRDTSTSYAALEKVKEQCGLYDPAESLQMTSTTQALRGTAVELELGVRNLARRPRTVTEVYAPNGFAVELPDLPYTVPPEGTGSFRVTLRVEDCVQAQETSDAESIEGFEGELAPDGALGFTPTGFFGVGANLDYLVGNLLDVSC